MRTLEQLKKLCRSHHTLDDISGHGSTIHAGFLSVLTEDEKQLIINEAFQSPDVFWSEERKQMMVDFEERAEVSTPTLIGDPTAPVNPEEILPGDFVTTDTRHRKHLYLVVLVDNTLGELRVQDMWSPLRPGWSIQEPIRGAKLFKRKGELNLEQAKAIDDAFISASIHSCL